MLRVTPVENPDSQRGAGCMEEDLEARAEGDGRMEEDLEAEAKGDGPEKEGKAGEVSDDERDMERELGCVCADRMRRLMKMGFPRRQVDAALRVAWFNLELAREYLTRGHPWDVRSRVVSEAPKWGIVRGPQRVDRRGAQTGFAAALRKWKEEQRSDAEKAERDGFKKKWDAWKKKMTRGEDADEIGYGENFLGPYVLAGREWDVLPQLEVDGGGEDADDGGGASDHDAAWADGPIGGSDAPGGGPEAMGELVVQHDRNLDARDRWEMDRSGMREVRGGDVQREVAVTWARELRGAAHEGVQRAGPALRRAIDEGRLGADDVPRWIYLLLRGRDRLHVWKLYAEYIYTTRERFLGSLRSRAAAGEQAAARAVRPALELRSRVRVTLVVLTMRRANARDLRLNMEQMKRKLMSGTLTEGRAMGADDALIARRLWWMSWRRLRWEHRRRMLVRAVAIVEEWVSGWLRTVRRVHLRWLDDLHYIANKVPYGDAVLESDYNSLSLDLVQAVENAVAPLREMDRLSELNAVVPSAEPVTNGQLAGADAIFRAVRAAMMSAGIYVGTELAQGGHWGGWGHDDFGDPGFDNVE